MADKGFAMSEPVPPAITEILSTSYARLVDAAAVLNAASDEYAKPIAKINQVLSRLNLGVTAWERVTGSDDDGYRNYWSHDIGYAKIHGEWGLAIRSTSGNHANPDQENYEEWAFSKAPPSHRIAAFDKLPALIDKLVKASEKTARKLTSKAEEARVAASTLEGLSKTKVQR